MPKMVSSHLEHVGWIFDPLMPRCFSLAGDLQSVRFPTQWWSPKSTEASPPQFAGSLQFCTCKLLCFMVIASDFLITTRRVAEASLCTWSWSCQRKPSPDLWQNRPRLYTPNTKRVKRIIYGEAEIAVISAPCGIDLPVYRSECQFFVMSLGECFVATLRPPRRAEFEGNACCFSGHSHPTSRGFLCFGTGVPRTRWHHGKLTGESVDS